MGFVLDSVKLSSRREALIHLTFIVTAPLLLAVFNTEWLYSPAGWLDPWVYLGYAINYADPTFFDDYYKIARLPWILTLFTAHHLLPPTAANHITHLGVFFATLVPFYLALRRLVAGRGALIAVLLLSVYTHAHGSGGWDYHNAIAGAFYAWAYYFLTVGWQQSPKQDTKALFIGGLFIGLMVHANVFFILFSLPMLLHAWALRNGIRRSELIQTLLLTSSGVVIVTLLLCLINWSVGRHFLFFKPLMVYMFAFAGDTGMQKPWWHPWSVSWVSGALYLSFTVGILCASAVALCIQYFGGNEKIKTNKVFYSIYFQLILAVTIWVALQTAGHTFLDWVYFAYPLIFPAFAAFAAIGSMNTVDEAKKLPILALLLFVFLLIIPLSFGATFLGGMATSYFKFLKWDMVPSTLLFFLACILFFVSNRLAVTTAAVALLGVANVNLNIDSNRPMILTASEVNHYYGFSDRDCSMRKQVFDAAIQLSSKLRTASTPFSKAVLWYSSEETLRAVPECSPILMKAHLGGPLVELGYGAVEMPWNTMPEITAIGEDKFKAWAAERKVLVVLAQNNEAISKMADRVRALGFSAQIGSAGVVDIGQAHLRIDLLSFQ